MFMFFGFRSSYVLDDLINFGSLDWNKLNKVRNTGDEI